MKIAQIEKRLAALEARAAEIDAREPIIIFSIRRNARAVELDGTVYERAEDEPFDDFCERIKAEQTKDLPLGDYIVPLFCKSIEEGDHETQTTRG